MSRISEQSLESVKAAVDMVDLVNGRTTLKKAGSRYAGKCPFHDERTASFSVNPVDKLYHCFGCGKSGDAITFVQDTESLDFVAAVEWLGERYGVEIAYDEVSPEADKRRGEQRRLLALLEDAAGFYSRYLWDAGEAADARTYLEERGLTEETARSFRLGFAPTAWDRVCAAALKKGFTAAELERAGLSSRGRRGPLDRFRGRLMFPLADARGRVRGFGARQMPGGEPPKYLNSPEGVIFHKSETVYGLDHARPTITAQSRAIVVEGYTDVLALHQAGMPESVASMGTALTEHQVRELARVCGSGTLYLAFDADAAGEEAALRGMQMAERTGMEVRVVALPDGRDPADVALSDPDAFRTALERSSGVLGFRIGRVLSAGGSRDQIYRRATAVLGSASPSVERDEQVRLVSGRLGLTPDLEAGLTRRQADGQAVSAPAPQRVRRSPRERDERLFLAMCLALPERGRVLLGDLEHVHFSDASHWEAATHIRRMLAGEDISEASARWAPLIGELNALAAREAASEWALEELYWKLHLYRAEDGLKAMRENADLNLSRQRELQGLEELRLSVLARLDAIRAQAPDR
ncbi:MAG TPA: DNA primase [Gaiellales bacterium]|nr:DNA primase [Gaiellales bacterium]